MTEAWASGHQYPFHPFARLGRLRAEPGSVTYLAGDGARISLTVPGDVVDALWVRERRNGSAGLDDPDAGVVVLRSAAGVPTALIRMDDWLPERPLVPDPDELWHRSRVPEVLATAGIPLRKLSMGDLEKRRNVTDGWAPGTLSQARALIAVRDWPAWIMLLRLVFLLSFGIVMIVTGATSRSGGPVAAMSLLLLAVLLCEVIPVGRQVLQDRRSRVAGSSWRPLPAVPVRRAFRRFARVRRTEEAIGLVTGEGYERWLPRGGPGAITGVGLLRPLSPEGTTLVVLLDDHQRVRAALPSSSWTDGRTDGVEQLAGFLGVPIVGVNHPTVLLEPDGALFDGQRAPQFSNGVLMFNPGDPVVVFSPFLLLFAFSPGVRVPPPVLVLAVSLFIGSWGRGLIRAGFRRWLSSVVEPAHPSVPSSTGSHA